MPKGKRRGQGWVHAARSEGEGVGKAPKPAVAERGRTRAAGGTTRDTERGKGKGTGRTRRDASRAPRRAATERMERSVVRSTNGGAARDTSPGTGKIQALEVRTRAQVTEDGTHDVGGGKNVKGDRKGTQGQAGEGRRTPPGTGRAGHGSNWERAEQRARDGEWGIPAAGRPAGAVHCPRHPTNAGALDQPPPPPPHQPLQHQPQRGGPHSPPTPSTPAPARPPRGAGAEGGAGVDGRCPGGGATGRGAGAAVTGAARGAGAGGRGGLALGPGLGRGSGLPGKRGPPPGGGGVWVAELGLLRDHQGDEEPALQCRAPLEGRGKPRGAPRGVGAPENQRGGSPGRDLSGMAQQGADVAGFPREGGRAPHHGCGGP